MRGSDTIVWTKKSSSPLNAMYLILAKVYGLRQASGMTWTPSFLVYPYFPPVSTIFTSGSRMGARCSLFSSPPDGHQPHQIAKKPHISGVRNWWQNLFFHLLTFNLPLSSALHAPQAFGERDFYCTVCQLFTQTVILRQSRLDNTYESANYIYQQITIN